MSSSIRMITHSLDPPPRLPPVLDLPMLQPANHRPSQRPSPQVFLAELPTPAKKATTKSIRGAAISSSQRERVISYTVCPSLSLMLTVVHTCLWLLLPWIRVTV